MGRPRKIENTFNPPKSKTKFSNPPGQSKGILDDHATRQNIDSKEGTIQHTPTLAKHIVNKEYVDAQIAGFSVKLNEVGNPAASKTFTMANKTLSFNYTAPSPAADTGAFEIEAVGGFSGDLVHIHQHTGNPGATTLVHIEADDADVVPLEIVSSGASISFSGAPLDMNSQKIINVTNPAALQDAATKFYVDSRLSLSAHHILFIPFSKAGLVNADTYMDMIGGIASSATMGYVMPRDGAITAISTALTANLGPGETVAITVYKNGATTGFENNFAGIAGGVVTDYDTQAADLDEFSAGDLLQIYIDVTLAVGDVTDVVTLVEVKYT